LRHKMPTPAKKLEQYLKAQFAKFAKTPYAIPGAVALTTLIYFLVLTYAGSFCLAPMITPLFLLGILWSMGTRSVKKLAIIAVAAGIPLSGAMVVHFVDYFQHVDPMIAEDEKGNISGSVSPLFGGSDTDFTFNLSIEANSSQVSEVSVYIYQLGFPSSVTDNYSMTFVSWDGNYTNYSYVTKLPNPVNQFVFWANISGEWSIVGQLDELGRTLYIVGPVYKDSWEVAKPLIPYSISSTYLQNLLPFAFILVMVWWIRRARRQREKQVAKWEAEQAAEKADVPTEKKRVQVPSLDRAMGKEEETFVCSECGADVPAEATSCPKCGEKFD